MADTAKARMTKGERDELLRLVRRREGVAKQMAKQRTAELLAEFEKNVAAIYPFAKDETWSAVYADASAYVAELNEKVTARCEELGIPEQFRPRMSLSWTARGENIFADRVAELRRVAKTSAAASEQAALSAIEAQSVAAQTAIIQSGLESEAAKAFLENLPAVAALMPSLDVRLIEDEMDRRKKREGRNRYSYYDA